MISKFFNFIAQQQTKLNQKLGITPGLYLDSDLNLATLIWFLFGWCLFGFLILFKNIFF